MKKIAIKVGYDKQLAIEAQRFLFDIGYSWALPTYTSGNPKEPIFPLPQLESRCFYDCLVINWHITSDLSIGAADELWCINNGFVMARDLDDLSILINNETSFSLFFKNNPDYCPDEVPEGL